MKKEVAEEIFKENGIVYIPWYKKIWLSITKFERYPEMATEGVGRAIGYLSILIIIFAIILSAFLVYQFSTAIKEGIDYLDQNISIIEYENGNLELQLSNQEKNIISNVLGKIVVDTSSEISEEDMEKYNKEMPQKGSGIIVLKDHAIISLDKQEQSIYYDKIFNELGIEKFNKEELIKFIQNDILGVNSYISCYIIVIMYTFLAYFLTSMLNVLLLSIFGILTSIIANLKIRYRAIFNMSVYAITISTILQLIYIIINLLTGFEIKYFDFMYTAVAYICLAASIFMIKSDVIKQHIELMKVVEEMKNQEQDEEEKKEDSEDKEKEDKKEKNETEDDKKEEDKLNDKNEQEGSANA